MKKINLLHFIILFIFSTNVFSGAGLIPAPPQIRANSYLLLDFNSDKLLAAHNIDERLSPASLTKMMTVYVVANELASGNFSLDEMVTVSEKAWRMPGSRMFIEVNRKVSVEDLLKGVVIQSGNDASVALAEHISGSEDVFAQVMNQHANRLGLKNTHYMNSTGLPDTEHYTTAHDLALLAVALIRDYTDVYALHSIKKFSFNNITQQNRNKLLWNDKSVDGIKTGHTEKAGFCLVSSALRDDMRLISVVLGADGPKSREQASQALLNYGFRFYETKKIYSVGDTITTTKVWKGESENIDLGVNRDLYVTIPRGQFSNIDMKFDLPKTTVAPVMQGEKQGMLKLFISDEEIISEPLVALQSIKQAGLFRRLKDDIRLIFE